MTMSAALLLAECLAGDSCAWNRLLDEHYGPAARFVAQMAFDAVETGE